MRRSSSAAQSSPCPPWLLPELHCGLGGPSSLRSRSSRINLKEGKAVRFFRNIIFETLDYIKQHSAELRKTLDTHSIVSGSCRPSARCVLQESREHLVSFSCDSVRSFGFFSDHLLITRFLRGSAAPPPHTAPISLHSERQDTVVFPHNLSPPFLKPN